MATDPWVPTAVERPIWQLASGYASARRRRHPLWMIEAYFDDSGRGNEPVFVLAGFLSTAERWAAFNEEWQAELDREPALRPFKMQHAMTGSEVWRPIPIPEREERLARFQAIIHKHAQIAFACIVRHTAYESLMRRRMNFHHTIYWIAFVSIINATMRYHEDNGLKDKVDFVFDRQAAEFKKARASFDQMMEEDPYFRDHVAGSPREGNDEEVLPLQAADYLAWQIRRLYAAREGVAAPRSLSIALSSERPMKDGDVPVITIEIDSGLLKRLGDEATAENLESLETEDWPPHMKEQIRDYLTAAIWPTLHPPRQSPLDMMSLSNGRRMGC